MILWTRHPKKKEWNVRTGGVGRTLHPATTLIGQLLYKVDCDISVPGQ